MLIALLTQNWYSPQWNSSIHSSINLPQIINTDLQQENQQAFTTRLKIQPHFKGFQDIKPETFGLLSKSQGKFNLDFIDGDHSRIISRKKKTLHKTTSSLMFSDTKKIPQVRTITCIPKIKTHSGEELCTHFQLNKSTQNQVTSNDDYEKSWTNNLRSRSLTEPTNLIIISYMLRLLGPRSPESSLPSSSELQRVLVVLSSSQFQGPFVLLCSSKFQRILVLFPRSEFRTISALQFQVFSIWLSSSRFQTDLVLISGYQLKPTQRINRSCNKMGATSREKGKSAMTRSVDDIVFSTKMSALDFEPSRQEETFLQLIGLDRFVTRVTWEMLNIPVVREVITNLNLHTMESVLNGQVFPIFSKDWRNQMRVVFYLTTFSAKREPGTPKVAAADIFPNFGERAKSKAGTCKVAECTIPEAKRPLRFFNSLLLLRTNTHSIPCQYIVHITDALNGKPVDWPTVYRELIEAELKNLKHELFKDKSTLLKSMVGPPITMMLMAEGLLSVQQEIEAGFLETSIFQDKSVPSSKKRKHDTVMELLGTEKGEPSHTQGDSSKQGVKPHILVARVEPEENPKVLISTGQNGTLECKRAALTNIHLKIAQANQLLEEWIMNTSDLSNKVEYRVKPTTGDNPTSQDRISELELQLQSLKNKHAAAEAQSHQLAETYHLEKAAIQKQYILLQNQYAEAKIQSRQVAEMAQAQIAELQSRQEFLQSEYTAVVNRNQHITAEERNKFQTQTEHM